MDERSQVPMQHDEESADSGSESQSKDASPCALPMAYVREFLQTEEEEDNDKFQHEDICDAIDQHANVLRVLKPQTAAVANKTKLLMAMKDYIKIKRRYEVHTSEVLLAIKSCR